MKILRGFSCSALEMDWESWDYSAWSREGSGGMLKPLPTPKEAPGELERSFGQGPGGWNWMIFQSLSNPEHSRILQCSRWWWLWCWGSWVQCSGECTAAFPDVLVNCWRQLQSLNDQATYFFSLLLAAFSILQCRRYIWFIFQFLLCSFDDASFSWSLYTSFVLEFVYLVVKLLSKLNMQDT